jgi:phosphonoacetaldehyde hydrolase
LSESEIDALSADSLAQLLSAARRRLHGAGAHYVVDSLSEAPRILEQINTRLDAGEKP